MQVCNTSAALHTELWPAPCTSHCGADRILCLLVQGEVEQISLMKPKAEDEHDSGLLEYLEDIIGTKHYVERIVKAAGQLEDLSEERRKHLQLVKTARAHCRLLSSRTMYPESGLQDLTRHSHCLSTSQPSRATVYINICIVGECGRWLQPLACLVDFGWRMLASHRHTQACMVCRRRC